MQITDIGIGWASHEQAIDLVEKMVRVIIVEEIVEGKLLFPASRQNFQISKGPCRIGRTISTVGRCGKKGHPCEIQWATCYFRQICQAIS